MINYSIAIMGTKPGTKKAQITETKAYGIAQCSELIAKGFKLYREIKN